MNSVNLFGRVGQDITLSTAANNRYMVKFWLAVNESDRTDWIPCTAWGSRAELIAKYVCKGDQLIVSGRLRPREYSVSASGTAGKDEIKRWDMPVEIMRVTFVAGRVRPGANSCPDISDDLDEAPAPEHSSDYCPDFIPDDEPGQDEESS